MKRYIRSDWSYTTLISSELPEEINVFLSSDSLDYRTIKDAVDAFIKEYNLIPSGRDGMNSEYDKDKGRFYSKYRGFVDKCKEEMKKLHPTGYGRKDYADIKKKELLNFVDYNFPYGWKYMV